MKITCDICGKQYAKNGIGTHKWRSHGNGLKHNPNQGFEKGRKIWNKGLTKETDERIAQISKSVSLSKKDYFKNNVITHTEEAKLKMSNSALKRVELGTHKGWISRNITSYPEKFFENVLKNLNLTNYEREYVVKHSNSKNYFLDFYFPELQIDLEIDGSQHNKEEVKNKDKERDTFLSSKGIIVYRIKWKSINDEIGKQYIKEEIEKFISFYKKQAGYA